MKNLFKQNLMTIFVFLIFPSAVAAQTGGQFAITQSVTAGGGGTGLSSDNRFGMTGTNAQPSAGVNSNGSGFGVAGGFWQALFAPTAAQVPIGGRVTTATGSGISSVRVLLTNQAGETQSALTNGFGYFRFEAVPAGETYILSVISKRYQFSNPSQVLFVSDNISDLVFIADW